MIPKSIFFATCLAVLMLAPQALAGSAATEPVLVTRVEGMLVVDTEGKVAELTLETELSPMIAPAVERGLRAMRFKPVIVAGVPTAARSAFTLQLLGTKQDGGLQVSFDGINFRAPKGVEAQRIDEAGPVARKMAPPTYPGSAMIAGIMGEVQLALLIDADGKPAKVAIVRSNVFAARKTRATVSGMRQLEQAALAAARKWTFTVPEGFASRSLKERTSMTQVVFLLDSPGGGGSWYRPGAWLEVLRAPARPVEWLGPDAGRLAADQVAPGSGGLAPVAGNLELAQPLSGTAVL